ncbi:AAA family ATPase [Aliarcobacter butzleri]|uniref:AAA family ATPase n=1 Tax=Aliarcobacter butzleri TaxID=28197 RepID=UPI001EDB67F7|nr:DUF3696 domain-containing protein [Aliarcobacter butzleri]MCG3654991.1 DUF3696 domain-containing protein [Aliarcobacter butzleri]
MKIKKLKITNFKSLKNTEISLGNLNLITGVNSVGKSSLIQSLLLLKQNLVVMMNNILFGQEIIKKAFSKDNNSNTYFEHMNLRINGDYLNLGNVNEIFFEEIFDEKIVITIFDENKETFNLEFSKDLQFTASGSNHFNIFSNNFQYIQTDRIIPQISYQLSNEIIDKGLIGTKGEYTAHYLAKNRHKEVISALKHPKSQTVQLHENVSLWLSDISENIEVKAKIFDELQQVDLKYTYTYGDRTTQDFSPLNVGFGLTYSLPIIVAILKANPNDLIIIENPESHLHPKAQSKLAELFAIASSVGIQLIIETHSDHILNGIRIAIKKAIIKPDETKIYYFRKEQGKLETIIDSIEVNEYGAIKKYPKHFFDQFDNDLDELIGL